MFFHHIPASNGANVSEYVAFFIEWTPVHVLLVSQSRASLIILLESNMSFFSNSSKANKLSLRIFEIQFPMLFYVCFKPNQKWKVVTKNKMENIGFNEENLSLVQDEDYDDYRTPDTSRIDAETSLTIPPDTTGVTSTLRLRQKLKRDKIVSLYRYLAVTGDRGLAELDQFMLNKNQKQVILNCFFSMLISINNPSVISVLVNFWRQRHWEKDLVG